jgi:hypothetical protein
MSNRKLPRAITISAWVHHDATGLRVRSRRRKKPEISTHRVHAHRHRKHDGVGLFRVELPMHELCEALEAAGHLEGSDRCSDAFVREALQIWLEELLAYGPRQ